MDEYLFNKIVSKSSRICKAASVDRLRDSSKFILNSIVNKKNIVVITGLRGVGKTTLLSKIYKKSRSGLYLDVNILLKYSVDLLDILEYAEARGYTNFLIDEIHLYPKWERDLKIFYDETHAKIIITGSSAISLKTRSSELASRASIYELHPLSFREYLMLKTGDNLQKLNLEEIIKRPRAYISKILPYLHLYEPYTMEQALPAAMFGGGIDVYSMIVDRILRYDLMSLREVDEDYLGLAYKTIKIVSTSNPGELSYSKLASSLGCSIKLARNIIQNLALSGLLYIVSPYGRGHKSIRSEDKILMPLSFRSAMSREYGVQPNIGAIREDFFVQHVGKCSYVKTGKERRTPVYAVDKYVLEVGGPSKGRSQISGKHAYLVKEAISIKDKELPLYLFGFLY